MKRILAAISLLFLCSTMHAATYTVTTTNDAGVGSLRYALQMCMTAPGPHAIHFNIPTSDAGYDASTGVWIITPSTVLPMVMQASVTIDGSTQTSNVGNTNPLGPEIVIDGGGTLDYGLRIMNASGAVVRGINFRRCTKGIQIYNSPNCSITACYIGTNELAETGMGNDIGLEFIAGSDNAVIGGTAAADRNIISGNQHIGIRLLDVQNCTVSGNYIGTDRTGTAAIPNYDGMSMEGAVQYCTIGGTTVGARNLISGNTDYGLPLFGVGATQNVIIGNYIGTDVTGTQAIGNTYGVLFDDGSFGNRVGGESAAERNIISGNVGYGVFFYNNGTNNNVLINNYIGTDYTGTCAVANTAGIIIDGISYENTMDGNVISGNTQVGIGINITGSDNNVIVRNRIGVDVNGAPLGNRLDGIRISQGVRHTIIGGTAEEGNIIAHNGGCGVYITNDNCIENRISCNSFYNNGSLAIDLFSPGVNANDAGDADEGANHLLNYPDIEDCYFDAAEVAHISGILDVPNPQNCEIQVYKAAKDPTNYGEGRTYLYSLTTENDGHWSLTIPRDTGLITLLTIDSQGNTSEFSRTVGYHDGTVVVENSKSNWRVWPNPTSGQVEVQCFENEFVGGELQLFNAEGKLMKSQFMDSEVMQIDLTGFVPGVYSMQATDAKGNIWLEKVILQSR